MYPEQLMMALLVASTALAGFTAVFVGQVYQVPARTEQGRWERSVDIVSLLISFGMFVVVVICTIQWFWHGSDWLIDATPWFFGVQLAGFISTFFSFWWNQLRRK